MKKIIVLISTVFIALSAATSKADTIYGRYRGILHQTGQASFSSPFILTFTPSLKLTLKYRVQGYLVTDVTKFRRNGTYSGYAKVGGSTFAVGSGRWGVYGNSIKFRGTIVSLGRSYGANVSLKFGSNKITGVNSTPVGTVRYTAVK